MNIDKEQFRKMFPNLAKEMEGEKAKIVVSSVRLDPQEGEKAFSKRFDGYNPDVIDFLRRCDNEKQAEEIIAYLEKREEITHEYASALRKQLKKKGVRSFGPKKEEAYYLRQAGYK
ncbi:MAG: DUF2095 domain-containing protein [Candidatus Bathyarchaeota archaeon]|nr:DUF2095 domain-containing protein [Candidatus Bathyarchaeota archaeon]